MAKRKAPIQYLQYLTGDGGSERGFYIVYSDAELGPFRDWDDAHEHFRFIAWCDDESGQGDVN